MRQSKPSTNFQPFVALDFETFTDAPDSICAVGLALVDAPDAIRTVHRLVKPSQERGGLFQYKTHGLTKRELENQAPWPVVWAEILPLLQDRPIYAHNASFDQAVLVKTNTAYRIAQPALNFFCTLEMARACIDEVDSYALDDLCAHFEIPLTHHRADCDACACAHLVLRLMGCATEAVATAAQFLGGVCTDLHPDDRIPYDAPFPEISFKGKCFCFTGDFVYERDLAVDATVELGADVKNGVSGKVHYVVVGRNGSDQWLGGDYGGGKVKKALELKSKGNQIAIVPEYAWAAALSQARADR